jgi:hypothetical protein
MNSEADLPLGLAQDLDVDRGGVGDAIAGIAPVHEGELHEGPAAA